MDMTPDTERLKLGSGLFLLHEAGYSEARLATQFAVTRPIVRRTLADVAEGVDGVLLRRLARRAYFARRAAVSFKDETLDPASHPQLRDDREQRQVNRGFLRLYSDLDSQRELAALYGLSVPAVQRQLRQARNGEEGISGHVLAWELDRLREGSERGSHSTDDRLDFIAPFRDDEVLTVVALTVETSDLRPLNLLEWREFESWMRGRSLAMSDLLKGIDLKGAPYRRRVHGLLARADRVRVLLRTWERAGIWVALRSDIDYPARLRRTLGTDSPVVLFGTGERSLLTTRPAVAIIGSRTDCREVLKYASDAGAAAAEAGICTVTGNARGVDRAALRGAMEAGGTSLGIVQSDLIGLARGYSHRQALDSGALALLSHRPPDAGYAWRESQRRTRYIYAISDAALVVCSRDRGAGWSWRPGVPEARLDNRVCGFPHTRPGDSAWRKARRPPDRDRLQVLQTHGVRITGTDDMIRWSEPCRPKLTHG